MHRSIIATVAKASEIGSISFIVQFDSAFLDCTDYELLSTGKHASVFQIDARLTKSSQLHIYLYSAFSLNDMHRYLLHLQCYEAEVVVFAVQGTRKPILSDRCAGLFGLCLLRHGFVLRLRFDRPFQAGRSGYGHVHNTFRIRD